MQNNLGFRNPPFSRGMLLEKLFMHVFDQKQWISGQLRQQVDSYEEFLSLALACNLAASDRELPSWLFDDGTESRSDAPVPVPDFSISPKEEKEVQCNVIDDIEQSKSKKECGQEDAFVRPRETGSPIIIIDDIVEVPELLPRVVDKSYEMSPYKDSDAEGDDGLDDLQEDQTRRKKYIPSWAQKEFLEDYLHSRKYMYPELIFSCKCSFDMSKVLKPRNQKHRF